MHVHRETTHAKLGPGGALSVGCRARASAISRGLPDRMSGEGAWVEPLPKSEGEEGEKRRDVHRWKMRKGCERSDRWRVSIWTRGLGEGEGEHLRMRHS